MLAEVCMQAFCGCEKQGGGGWGDRQRRRQLMYQVISFSNPKKRQRGEIQVWFDLRDQKKKKKRYYLCCRKPQQLPSATSCFNARSPCSQENEEDICMRWVDDHHYSNWKPPGSQRWSAHAGEIPLRLQRLLQGVCHQGQTHSSGGKFQLFLEADGKLWCHAIHKCNSASKSLLGYIDYVQYSQSCFILWFFFFIRPPKPSPVCFFSLLVWFVK